MRERAERLTEAQRGGSIGRGGRDRGHSSGPIPALLRTGTKRSVFAAALLVVALTLVAETDARALEEAGETVLYVGAPAVSVPTAREAGVVAHSYKDEASPAVLAALGHDPVGGSDPLVEEALASVTALPGEPDVVTADEAEDAGRVFLAQTDEGTDEPGAPGGMREYASGGPVRPELGDGEGTPEPANEGADEEPRDPGTEVVAPPPAGEPEFAWASTGVGGSVSAPPPEAEPEPIELVSSPPIEDERSGDPAVIPPAGGKEVSAPEGAIARAGPVPDAEQVPASLTSEESMIDDGTGESGGEPTSAPTVEPAGDGVVGGDTPAPPESPEETTQSGTPPAYTSELPEAALSTDGEERISLVATPAAEDSGTSGEVAPFPEEVETSTTPPEDTPPAPEDAGERTAREGDLPEETPAGPTPPEGVASPVWQRPESDPSAGEPHADGVQPPERPEARYPEEMGEDSSDGDPGGRRAAHRAPAGQVGAPSGAEGEPDNGLSEEGAPRPEAPAEAHLRNGDAETGAPAQQTEPEGLVRRPDRPPAQFERPPGSGGERPGVAKSSEERGEADPGPAGRRDPGGHDGAPRGRCPERAIERIKRSDGVAATVARHAERDPGIAAGRERGHPQTADRASATAGAGRGGVAVGDETHHGRADRETSHRTKESKATEEGE